MYTVEVKGQFESAHRLLEYKGKCENLHGHNWKVTVTCASETLDNIGIVIDFRILKDYLREITGMLDHTYLNDVPLLSGINPTSENIAKVIYDEMKKKVTERHEHVYVLEIAVWETEGACARYSE